MERRRAVRGSLAALALLSLPGLAAAHGGGLSNAAPERLAIPTWLFLATGGGVVAASFLLASFVTDRVFVERIHRWYRAMPFPTRIGRRVGAALGLVGLALVVVSGLFGPEPALRNAAVLTVWVGWWAGYAMSVYLFGNSWPAVNPFRTLASPITAARVDYPERLGSWPAVVGLLVLVWVEVVSPLASDPRLLAVTVLAYLGVSLVGAAAFGETWFDRVDPLSAVFRAYGRVAPFRLVDGDLRLRYHGSDLATDRLPDVSAAAFVVALVWATTFDGFVDTRLWWDLATGLVRNGFPIALLYPGGLALGYLCFLGLYWAAARATRSAAPTFLSARALARLFAPSLLAIAAGYHLAHYLSYFLSLAPALLTAAVNPVSGANPLVLSLPPWFGGLSIASVLLGHLLAIWVAHGIAYERFPSRLQAIRSQYPVTVVMVVYTMVSLWIVTQPAIAPPYV